MRNFLIVMFFSFFSFFTAGCLGLVNIECFTNGECAVGSICCGGQCISPNSVAPGDCAMSMSEYQQNADASDADVWDAGDGIFTDADEDVPTLPDGGDPRDAQVILDFETLDGGDGQAEVYADGDTSIIEDAETTDVPRDEEILSDADTSDSTDADTSPPTDTDTAVGPDTSPPVCGDERCDEDEVCETDCGPRIVTLTVEVNENDFSWYVHMTGRTTLAVDRLESDGSWTRVGNANEPLAAESGQVFRANAGVTDFDFGDCNIYTVPDDCVNCIYEAPRLVFNIERLTFTGIPGLTGGVNFSSYCVADERITDIVREDLGGCRGNGQVFNLAGSWVCLQPLGDLNGPDKLRGTSFGRCLSGECTDYVFGTFKPYSLESFDVATTATTYSLTVYRR